LAESWEDEPPRIEPVAPYRQRAESFRLSEDPLGHPANLRHVENFQLEEDLPENSAFPVVELHVQALAEGREEDQTGHHEPATAEVPDDLCYDRSLVRSTELAFGQPLEWGSDQGALRPHLHDGTAR